MSVAMTALLHYAANLAMSTGWALWLILGALIGVPRHRTLRALGVRLPRPPRTTWETAASLAAKLPGPVPVAAPPMEVTHEVVDALVNQGARRGDAVRAVAAGLGEGGQTFNGIFRRAMASLTRQRGKGAA